MAELNLAIANTSGVQQSGEKLPNVHIGQLIKNELERQERSVSWFARKLYCDRSNVYKLFKHSSVDTDMLMRISVILKRNFFAEYAACLSFGSSDGVIDLADR